jgi:YihY family inner membrane protein
MSTASPVPETRDLDGDDAWRTLEACGRRQLVRDAYIRMRYADGFSHARSMAYVTALLLVQGIIAIVGFATAFNRAEISKVIVRSLRAAAPGPAGTFLTSAATQAHRAGAGHRFGGLIFGLVAGIISGATLFGQLERGFNRIYGIEQDRPTLRKYGRALVMTLTAGLLVAAAFAALAFGRTIGASLHNHAVNTAWSVVRWPFALAILSVAMTLVLRWTPHRRQPRLSWLAFGATIAVGLWAIVTVLLGLFFRASTSFGKTYGPLAGIVALLLWALLASVAILIGGAVAAQLEAVRSGVSEPRDIAKVEHSEPDRADRALSPAGAR